MTYHFFQSFWGSRNVTNTKNGVAQLLPVAISKDQSLHNIFLHFWIFAQSLTSLIPNQVDIQALAHAVELTRQGAVDSLKFAKGDLFQAFQVAISCSLIIFLPAQ